MQVVVSGRFSCEHDVKTRSGEKATSFPERGWGEDPRGIWERSIPSCHGLMYKMATFRR